MDKIHYQDGQVINEIQGIILEGDSLKIVELRGLGLNSEFTAQLLTSLSKLSSVQTLIQLPDIERDHYNSEEVVLAFTEIISKSQSLKTLDFSGKNLSASFTA